MKRAHLFVMSLAAAVKQAVAMQQLRHRVGLHASSCAAERPSRYVERQKWRGEQGSKRGILFSSTHCDRVAHPNEVRQVSQSRHPVTAFSSGLPPLVSTLVQSIAERCQFPQHWFFLTSGGKVVDIGLTLQDAHIGKDSCLVMHGRLRGGGRVVVPGEWECAVCHSLGGSSEDVSSEEVGLRW